MNELDALALKYGTDKGTMCHGYTIHYHELLKSTRGTTTNVMEIGLHRRNWKGNKHVFPSLMMWRDYFPKAQIVGVDMHDFTSEDPRIRIMKVDQSKQDELDALEVGLAREGLLFDLIVDDASHYAQHQAMTLIALWGRLKPGGIYIIEDLQCDRGDEERVRMVNVIQRIACRRTDREYPFEAELQRICHHEMRARWLMRSLRTGPYSAVALEKYQREDRA